MVDLDQAIAALSSRDDGTEPAAWAAMGYARFPNAEPNAWVDESLPSSRLAEVDDAYDVVIIGSGAGGGMAAAVLARAGARVLVVERGDSLGQTARDHVRNHRIPLLGHNTGPGAGHPRVVGDREVEPWSFAYQNNAMTVGGGTRVYGAQAWRFPPDDFRMASRYGIPDGSSLADWPITYDDLAPHYDAIERELGVSSFPENREGATLRAGAEKLGWSTRPTPMLIDPSRCIRCGECIGFSCPVGAKIGSHNTTLPDALAHGARLVTGALAARIDDERVTFVDDAGTRVISGGHVVVAAGAIESARLLLNSEIGGDHVGRHLQGHPYAGAFGLYEEPVLDGLGPGPSIATQEHVHGNEGVIGGGLIGNEFVKLPIIHWASALPPGADRSLDEVIDTYRRTVHLMGPAHPIPSPDARVTISSVRDRFGVPVVRLSGADHDATTPTLELIAARAEEWLEASGAIRTWQMPVGRRTLSAGQHQAGTCRMGDDPATSVVDPFGRVHGHDRLWVMDGSVHVTNGSANPVLTIMATARRAAMALASGRLSG